MLISFRLSSTPPTDDMQRQMQIMTTFVMPIMLPFFMKGFSSAFILYWIVYNVVSTIFQYRMMKAGDPNKSVWKALVGDGLIPAKIGGDDAKTTAEAVPPRPKSGGASKPIKASAKVKTLTPEKPIPASSNGHASQSNAANGSVQTPLDSSADDASPDASTQVSGTITVSQKNGKPNGGSNNGSSPAGSPSSLNGSRARRRRRF